MSQRILDLEGLPETKALLRSYTDRQMQNRLRRGTRAGAKVYRAELRRRGRSPEFPDTFRKTRTRGHRNPIGTSVGISSSLVNIFEGGATPHPIGGRQFLSNPGEGFFARGPVDHPGMDARPIIGPAFDAVSELATAATMEVIFEGHDVPGLGDGD